MDTRYKLDGVVIKAPREFTIEKYHLTKSGRLANGDMSMEYLSSYKKRKFQFSYEILSATHLTIIEDLIDGGPVFLTLEFPECGVQKTAVVYAGAIKKDKYRSPTDGLFYYRNISFALIER